MDVMEAKEAAKQDWEAGMKYREIAEKYGVSVGTVKSWASRYWKKDAAKTATAKLQPAQPKAAKKQPPKKKPGAPPGNHNRLLHGCYSKSLCWDTFTEEEKRMLKEHEEMDEETRILHELATLDVRERRLMQEIAKFKDTASGMAVESIEKTTGGAMGGQTQTKAVSVFHRIQHLETLLTSVQRSKLRYIEALRRVRAETENETEEDKVMIGFHDKD